MLIPVDIKLLRSDHKLVRVFRAGSCLDQLVQAHEFLSDKMDTDKTDEEEGNQYTKGDQCFFYWFVPNIFVNKSYKSNRSSA